ncbi:hypothetical protein [Methanococcoides sp. LMO-2]|uniref:Uncharacterized protein n=1 Tax=Methanococcoides cohabitans TaxID=3136559 RepID=A0ABU9KXD7_9EURY
MAETKGAYGEITYPICDKCGKTFDLDDEVTLITTVQVTNDNGSNLFGGQISIKCDEANTPKYERMMCMSCWDRYKMFPNQSECKGRNF